MRTALSECGLSLKDDPRCTQYILNGYKQAHLLEESIFQTRQEEADRRTRKEQLAAFIKTLPELFVQYMESYRLECHHDETRARQQAEGHNSLFGALVERGLELRSNSHLCRDFISNGSG
ncbi:hypothetical protein GN958_ATG11924 [Phytophthora infestans]|nr:hypothetical protein GN958_ATG11924 [Phytophthora infestans]